MSKGRGFSHFAVGCVAVLIGLAPATIWAARNWVVADYFGISCVTAINIMKYKAAAIMADLHGANIMDLKEEKLLEES
jgi:hypothetical protein